MKLFVTVFLSLYSTMTLAGALSSFHLNTRTELQNNPATRFELGEITSPRTAFYLGSLFQNPEQPQFASNVETNITYIYARIDYHFNGVLDDGFYMGGVLSYAEIETILDNGPTNTEEDRATGIGLGIRTGHNWSFGDLTIGTSLKAQAYAYDTTTSLQSSGNDEDITIPHHENFAGSIDLGYKF